MIYVVFSVGSAKAKKELSVHSKYKLVTLGDLNATIGSSSKESGLWDSILGHNNSDRIETNIIIIITQQW